MRIINKSSTYNKVLAVLFVSSFFLLMLCFFIFFYTLKQEEQVYENSTTQFKNEVNSLLELNTQSTFSTLSDIAFWDEFADYIKTKNKVWFDDNVTRIIKLYKANYLAVYDMEGHFIAKTSDSKIKSLSFIPKEVMQNLFHKRLTKCYLKIPEGYAEVYGTSIHPSNDFFTNQTHPVGYYFLVRLLNKSYFENLQKISSANIILTHSSKKKCKDCIEVIQELKDHNGKTIVNLLFQRPNQINFNITRYILYALMGTFFVHLLIFTFISRKWVYRPLELIESVLKTKSDQAIQTLKQIPGEFGTIGHLFEENSKQSKELECAKLKAEESDQLKSSFLTNMSHEIRTPMNAIVGFSDLLLRSDLNETERFDYAKVIHNSGLNLVSIIEDLIQMSKIDTNQIAPNFSEVGLEKFIENIFSTIKIASPVGLGINFFVVKPKNPIIEKIITDEIKLRQVLTNLVNNAMKYTKEGYVCFGYQTNLEKQQIEFTVKDSGIGIEKEAQEFIFERFRRVENDFTIKAGGLGLGLAISKAYVEMLGGELTVNSSKGKGATFTFLIPLKHTATNVTSTLAGSILKPRTSALNVTILIAEDDNINFLLLQKIMNLRQYRIIRAKDGLEAVTICATDAAVHLVLMDIKMPKLNGFEASEKIRLMRPDLPIIAQTAYASAEDKMSIEQAGFSGYISKPINKEKLFELIEKLI